MSRNYYANNPIYNLNVLRNNVVYEIGCKIDVTEIMHKPVHIYSIEGDYYYIPEKCINSFKKNKYLIKYLIPYSNKKDDKINMYYFVYFKTLYEANTYKNNKEYKL